VANRVAGTAVSSATVISVAVAVLLFLFADQVASLAGLHDLAHEFGVQYLHIMTLTIALQAAQQIGMACLRGAGDTVRPMLITGLVAVVNILTSTSFTFGLFGAPRLGVRGIALGTAMAFLVGGIATLVLLLRGDSHVKLHWRHFRIVPHILLRLVRIGLPSWLEGLFLWLGQFVIVIFVINANDQAVGVSGATMAAHNTVLRIESLAFLPGFGFGIACAAMVGQYLGARRPLEARRAVSLCNVMALATMTLAAAPMVLFPRFLLGVMVDSACVVDVGVWALLLAGLAQPGFACAITFGNALRGAGDTVRPMVCTLSGIFLVRMPIVIFALWIFHRLNHPDWGLIAVWIGIFVDLNYRGLVNYLGFRQGGWMVKKL
jgi:putative MATE family efflux protein